MLDGHPDPEDIVKRAAALGRQAVALTDHGSVSGHVQFERASEGEKISVAQFASHVLVKDEAPDIKPIYGLEAYTTPDVSARGQEYQRKYHLTLLAKNLTGYRNLNALVTRSYDEGWYYRQSIDGRMLLEQRDGLVVLSGCDKGNFMAHIERQDWRGARDLARRWQAALGDDFYIEIQHFPHVSQKAMWAWSIAEELGIKTVLTCDTHYLDQDGWRFQQFLWSIRESKPVDDFRIEHAYLWEADRLFAFCQEHAPQIDWVRIFENTCEVAEKIERFKLPRAPHVRYPMEGDKLAYIRQRVVERLAREGLWDNPEYQQRLERELNVIEYKDYADYFLVVADMINWAKSKGIFVGPARGSAAGSIVCYGLRITEVDPIRYGLIFERFVDETRTDLPDIDVDFEDERRDEVFAYMERKWGSRSVARISTFARLGGKQVLDDAARSYKIPFSEIDVIKRHLVERSSGDQRAELTLQDTIDEFPEARQVYERYPALQIVAGTQGKIRHLGKHAAGLIVTSEPVDDYVAIYRDNKTGERLIALDWRDAAYLNLMKIDVLGLRELSILREIAETEGLTLEDVYNLPRDDAATLAGFNQHDYLGIFQYTGLSTKGVASRIHLENLEHIADVNALARPGPLHSGSTEKYIKGKNAGRFIPILPQPQVQHVLAPTYGQLIYQEQIMQILRDAGGLSWQDVCSIRNIVAKSKGREAFEEYWPKWREGCDGNGIAEQDARMIWDAMSQFGRYGFNKSHSLSYGLVAYWSMYCKVHFPRSFYLAHLRRSNDGAVAARFINEAMAKGIPFAPFDLSATAPGWHIDSAGAIKPGWTAIKGVGDTVAEELCRHAPFKDMDDLRGRNDVKRRVVNKGVVEKIEEKLGWDVPKLYGIHVWPIIDEVVPGRQKIALVNEGFTSGPYIAVVGRIGRINKKNRIEEWEHKGKDTSKLDPNDPHDYVLIIIEDETDSCMVYVTPEDYVRWSKFIWADDTVGSFLKVVGTKMHGLQGLRATKLEFAIVSAEGQPRKAVANPFRTR